MQWLHISTLLYLDEFNDLDAARFAVQKCDKLLRSSVAGSWQHGGKSDAATALR